MVSYDAPENEISNESGPFSFPLKIMISCLPCSIVITSFGPNPGLSIPNSVVLPKITRATPAVASTVTVHFPPSARVIDLFVYV